MKVFLVVSRGVKDIYMKRKLPCRYQQLASSELGLVQRTPFTALWQLNEIPFLALGRCSVSACVHRRKSMKQLPIDNTEYALLLPFSSPKMPCRKPPMHHQSCSDAKTHFQPRGVGARVPTQAHNCLNTQIFLGLAIGRTHALFGVSAIKILPARTMTLFLAHFRLVLNHYEGQIWSCFAIQDSKMEIIKAISYQNFEW